MRYLQSIPVFEEGTEIKKVAVSDSGIVIFFGARLTRLSADMKEMGYAVWWKAEVDDKESGDWITLNTTEGKEEADLLESYDILFDQANKALKKI